MEVIATDKEILNQDFSDIPFDKIIRVGQRSMLYRDTFTVSWLLGRFCNYKCSYCWPYASSRTKDHRPTKLCLMTIDEIKKQARERGFNSFNWSLSGGEPTFHPGYLDILKHLADDEPNCSRQRIHMTSNCSRTLPWFKKYIKIANIFDRASITASVHFEHLNTKDKVADFAYKLRYCADNEIRVTINMVMLPDKFWEMYDWVQFFKDNYNLHTTLKPQSDPTASFVVEGYTQEMLDILYNDMKTDTMEIDLVDEDGNHWEVDQSERLNAFNFNQFKGWECSAGYRSIIIREPDGAIKRSYSCSDEPLGNIETGFKLFPKVMPCITDTCVSSADSKIPKRRPGCTMRLWKS